MDKKAILKLMEECYERHTPDKTKILELKALEEALNDPLGSQNKVASNRNIAAGKKLLKAFKVFFLFVFNYQALSYYPRVS